MSSALSIHESSWDIDAILFDKDGTIVDFPSLWVNWLKGVLADVSSGETLRSTERALGISIQDGVVDPNGPLAIGSVIDVKTVLAGCLYEAGWSWDVAKQRVNKSIEEIEVKEHYMEDLQLLPGLKGFLHRLERKNIKKAVVTADETAVAEKHLKALGIRSYFEAVIGSDQVEKSKPYPDMLHRACHSLDVEPSRCLMLGDTNSDMRTGRAAGTKASIGLVSYTTHKDHLIDADEIINHYDDIQF
ncbi:phosphoglycolate phosphatase [Salibacterium salarium]|uniref:HAD family hydrolase n=1 Tax=Salibacterium salarium TaxID=284579 RepID=UPI0027810364|nr:HAD family hydrolase [Salibacterium salarium]MDQ0297901.1 phosphoglycolate phosphatase [Salibacterium salarium]